MKSAIVVRLWQTTFAGCLLLTGISAQGQLAPKWTNGALTAPHSIACSPDGTLLAIGDASGIQLITLATGNIQSLQTSASGGVKSVAFSPDGKWLADGGSNASTVAEGGVLELRKLSSGQITTYPTTANFGVASVAFSPDGKKLAAGGLAYNYPMAIETGILEIWTVQTGKSTNYKTTCNTGINTVAFTPDGTALVDGGSAFDEQAGVYSGPLELWSLSSGKPKIFASASTWGVLSIAISPDSKTLAAGGQNSSTGILETWNISKGTSASLETPSYGVFSLAFSHDGKSLAAGALGFGTNALPTGLLQIWSTSNWTSSTLATQMFNVLAVAFSPKDAVLYDGGLHDNTNYGVLEDWTLPAGTLIQRSTTAAKFALPAVAYSPDGQWAAGYLKTSNHPQVSPMLQIWNAQTGSLLQSLNMTTAVTSMAISPDGQTVAAFGPAGLTTWKPAANTTQTLQTGANWAYGGVAYAPNGLFLADCGQSYDQASNTLSGIVELRSTATGSPMLLPTATLDATSAAFSPDSSLIAIGGYGDSGGVVELWNSQAGTLATTLLSSAEFVTSVSFSPDGKTLVCGGFSRDTYEVYTPTLELWNVATGKLVKALPLNANDAVVSTQFSPDGTTIWAGTYFEIVAFTNVTYKLLQSFPTGTVSSLALSPDASGLLYSTTSGQLVDALNPYFTAGWLKGISVSPTTLTGGSTANGVITLGSAAPAGGLVVTLTATTPGKLTHPTVTIPAGQTTGSFQLGTAGIASVTQVTVKASCKAGTASATITVNPPTLSSLVVNPSSVKGGASLQGTITLSGPAPVGGAVIKVSANSSKAVPPAAITIPVGKVSATFTIKTAKVASSTAVTLTATFRGANQTASLVIN